MLVGAAAVGTAAAMFVPRADAPTPAMRAAAPRFSLRQYAPVIMPMLGIGWFWMIGAISLANLPNFVHDHLRGGDSELSIVQGTFAIGAGLGSVLAGILGGRMRAPLKLAALGVAGTVLGSVLIYLVGNTAGGITAMLVFALIGTAAANSCFAVPLMAAVQSRAPEAVRAQMMGVANTLNGLGATIGAALVPVIRGTGLSAAAVFLVAAGAQALLLAVMWWRRRALLANAQVKIDGELALGPLAQQRAAEPGP
jgi:MFS family permease